MNNLFIYGCTIKWMLRYSVLLRWVASGYHSRLRYNTSVKNSHCSITVGMFGSNWVNCGSSSLHTEAEWRIFMSVNRVGVKPSYNTDSLSIRHPGKYQISTKSTTILCWKCFENVVCTTFATTVPASVCLLPSASENTTVECWWKPS